MKFFFRLVLLWLVNIPIALAASLIGAYGGLGLGQTRLIIPPGNVFNASSIGGTQYRRLQELDGKISLGYIINQYLGVECSFADYARSFYSATVFNGPSAQLRYNLSAVNLIAKGFYPWREKKFFPLSPYFLGGISEVVSNVRYTNSGVPVADNVNVGNFSLGNTLTKKLRPIWGLGLHHQFKDSFLSFEFEFSRIVGMGNVQQNKRAIPTADMFTINLMYHFTSPNASTKIELSP